MAGACLDYLLIIKELKPSRRIETDHGAYLIDSIKITHNTDSLAIPPSVCLL